MKIFRGTDWIHQFDVTQNDNGKYRILSYDGSIDDLGSSPFGVGLYFTEDIEDVDCHQYVVTANIDCDVVYFNIDDFRYDAQTVEGSVYRMLQQHSQLKQDLNRARYFKTYLDVVLNGDIKAVIIDGIVVVYDLSLINWETINDNIQCIPFDPFK